MDYEQRQATGNFRLPLILLCGLLVYLPIMAARLATGQDAAQVNDLGYLLGSGISLALLLFLGWKAFKRLGREFPLFAAGLWVILFVIAFVVPQPAGNIIAALLGLVVMLVYLFKVRRDYLAGKYN